MAEAAIQVVHCRWPSLLPASLSSMSSRSNGSSIDPSVGRRESESSVRRAAAAAVLSLLTSICQVV